MKKILLVVVLGVFVFAIAIWQWLIFRPLSMLYWRFIENYRNLITYLPQSLRAILNMYDSNGLKHNLRYLNTRKNEVAQMPIEQQAKFADQWTINLMTHSGDYEEHNHYFNQSFYYNRDFHNYNTTSIGNLAYFILNVKNDSLKEEARNLRSEYLEYLNYFSESKNLYS